MRIIRPALSIIWPTTLVVSYVCVLLKGVSFDSMGGGGHLSGFKKNLNFIKQIIWHVKIKLHNHFKKNCTPMSKFTHSFVDLVGTMCLQYSHAVLAILYAYVGYTCIARILCRVYSGVPFTDTWYVVGHRRDHRNNPARLVHGEGVTRN